MVDTQVEVLIDGLGLKPSPPMVPVAEICHIGRLERRVRSGGIILGGLLVGLCGGTVWWANDRFGLLSRTSDNAVFYRAELFLIHTLALVFAVAGLGVVTVAIGLVGSRRAIALVVIGLAGIIFCVILRHLVVSFFLPWYVCKQLVVLIPPAVIWILNQHQAAPSQARKYGLLRAVASGMALAIAFPALTIRLEGLVNTWLLPHLLVQTHRGLLGLRMLLLGGILANLAMAVMGMLALVEDWHGDRMGLRRWINRCLGLMVVGMVLGLVARAVFFQGRQLDDLLVRSVLVCFWLLMALGGVEGVGVWLQSSPILVTSNVMEVMPRD